VADGERVKSNSDTRAWNANAEASEVVPVDKGAAQRGCDDPAVGLADRATVDNCTTMSAFERRVLISTPSPDDRHAVAQALLLPRAGDAVAEHSLQEVLKLGVAASGAIEEGEQ